MDLNDALAACHRHYLGLGVTLIDPEKSVLDRDTYWYLPDPEAWMGRRGVIISKEDCALFVVGSPLPEAFWAYERGLFTGTQDLIITSCSPDLDATIDILTKTGPAHRGKKIPGPGREGWYQRLSKLPTVIFSNFNLQSYARELMEAEQTGVFTFEIRPSKADT